MAERSEQTTNWAGNVVFGAARYPRPTSVDQVQQAVAGAERMRVLGSGHSFNRIADTTGDLLLLDGLPRTVEVDGSRRQAQVGGGVRFAEVYAEVARAGLALPNTGSLPHISVAGAAATGTHGSGVASPSLACSVAEVTLVSAEGDLVTLDRGDPDFPGCVLALGRLGVVVSSTLDLVDDFSVAQTVVEGVGDDTLAERLDEILAAAYSVSVFTDSDGSHRVWLKERVGREGAWTGSQLWGGQLAAEPLNPVRGMPAEHATAQLGVPGPWFDRLPHFRSDFTPSSGDELQSEYLLPLEDATAAWRSLSEIRSVLAPVLQVAEVRTIGADDLWLGLSGGRACVAFHFTWLPDAAAVDRVLAQVEERLDGFGARPHWGKVFRTPPARLAGLYPRLGDFRSLVQRQDPRGVFGNDLVDGWIGLA